MPEGGKDDVIGWNKDSDGLDKLKSTETKEFYYYEASY